MFRKDNFIAAGMAVVGVTLLELDEGEGISFSVGDVLSLIQPIAFGIGFWRTEHVLAQYPNEANRITAAQLIACFILSSLYTLFTEDVPSSEQFVEWFTSIDIVIALVWTGIMTTALTVYLETIAMRTISASETAVVMSSEPLWASVFTWLLVGEVLGFLGFIGGLFIVGACMLDML